MSKGELLYEALRDFASQPRRQREPAFYHGTVRLPGGWTMRRVRLDENGVDVHDWRHGPGPPLFVIAAPGPDDTLSVRAPCPVIALAIVDAEGWPPKRMKRFNWEYQV